MTRVTDRSADWRSLEAELGRDYMTASNARRELLAGKPAKLRALQNLAPQIRASGRCLIFTQVKSAAEECARALRDAGARAAAIHSGLTAKQRRTLIEDFEAGELQPLVSAQVLDEGVDLPDAELGIIVAGQPVQTALHSGVPWKVHSRDHAVAVAGCVRVRSTSSGEQHGKHVESM
jgi:superfamily II DNA or RNA helicase